MANGSRGRGGRGRGQPIAAAAEMVTTPGPMQEIFHGLNLGSYNTGFSQGPRF